MHTSVSSTLAHRGTERYRISTVGTTVRQRTSRTTSGRQRVAAGRPVDLCRNGPATTPGTPGLWPCCDVETDDVHGVQRVRAHVRGISTFDATTGNAPGPRKELVAAPRRVRRPGRPVRKPPARSGLDLRIHLLHDSVPYGTTTVFAVLKDRRRSGHRSVREPVPEVPGLPEVRHAGYSRPGNCTWRWTTTPPTCVLKAK